MKWSELEKFKAGDLIDVVWTESGICKGPNGTHLSDKTHRFSGVLMFRPIKAHGTIHFITTFGVVGSGCSLPIHHISKAYRAGHFGSANPFDRPAGYWNRQYKKYDGDGTGLSFLK